MEGKILATIIAGTVFMYYGCSSGKSGDKVTAVDNAKVSPASSVYSDDSNLNREINSYAALALVDQINAGTATPDLLTDIDSAIDSMATKVRAQVDTNGDGVISSDEMALFRTNMLSKVKTFIDSNGDGVISDDEMNALKQKIKDAIAKATTTTKYKADQIKSQLCSDVNIKLDAMATAMNTVLTAGDNDLDSAMNELRTEIESLGSNISNQDSLTATFAGELAKAKAMIDANGDGIIDDQEINAMKQVIHDAMAKYKAAMKDKLQNFKTDFCGSIDSNLTKMADSSDSDTKLDNIKVQYLETSASPDNQSAAVDSSCDKADQVMGSLNISTPHAVLDISTNFDLKLFKGGCSLPVLPVVVALPMLPLPIIPLPHPQAPLPLLVPAPMTLANGMQNHGPIFAKVLQMLTSLSIEPHPGLSIIKDISNDPLFGKINIPSPLQLK